MTVAPHTALTCQVRSRKASPWGSTLRRAPSSPERSGARGPPGLCLLVGSGGRLRACRRSSAVGDRMDFLCCREGGALWVRACRLEGSSRISGLDSLMLEVKPRVLVIAVVVLKATFP
jgi:hypothetical protein